MKPTSIYYYCPNCINGRSKNSIWIACGSNYFGLLFEKKFKYKKDLIAWKSKNYPRIPLREDVPIG